MRWDKVAIVILGFIVAIMWVYYIIAAGSLAKCYRYTGRLDNCHGDTSWLNHVETGWLNTVLYEAIARVLDRGDVSVLWST